MGTYSVAEARNRLPALIDKAIDGEEVVITPHGKPVAELHAAICRRLGARLVTLHRRLAAAVQAMGIDVLVPVE
jgi:antitoxin (DNA-binding transcriptional repressor) of toxin-antitoxin stability system